MVGYGKGGREGGREGGGGGYLQCDGLRAQGSEDAHDAVLSG